MRVRRSGRDQQGHATNATRSAIENRAERFGKSIIGAGVVRNNAYVCTEGIQEIGPLRNRVIR